jgi:hypothetical protein
VTRCEIVRAEDGGSMFLRNVGICSPASSHCVTTQKNNIATITQAKYASPYTQHATCDEPGNVSVTLYSYTSAVQSGQATRPSSLKCSHRELNRQFKEHVFPCETALCPFNVPVRLFEQQFGESFKENFFLDVTIHALSHIEPGNDQGFCSWGI